MQFSIPGLQSPKASKKDYVRRFTSPKGIIDFKIFGPVNNSTDRPHFEVFVERADHRLGYQTVFQDTKGEYVFQKLLPGNLIEYRFFLNYKEHILDRGNYRVTVCVDDQVTEYWLTVEKSPKYGQISQEEYDYIEAVKGTFEFGYKELISQIDIVIHATVGIESKVIIEKRYGEIFNRWTPEIIEILTDSILTREHLINIDVPISLSAESDLVRERLINATNSMYSVSSQSILIRERNVDSTGLITDVNANTNQNKVHNLTSDPLISVKRPYAIMANPDTGIAYSVELESTNNIVVNLTTQPDILVGKLKELESTQPLQTIVNPVGVTKIEAPKKPLTAQTTNIYVFTYTVLTKFTVPPVTFVSEETIGVTTDTNLFVQPPVWFDGPASIYVTNDFAFITTELDLTSINNVTVQSTFDSIITREQLLESDISSNDEIGVTNDTTMYKGEDFAITSNNPGDNVIGVISTTELTKITVVLASTTINITTTITGEPVELFENAVVEVEDWPADTAFNPTTNEFAVVNAKSNNLSVVNGITATNPNPPVDLEYKVSLPIENWTVFGTDPVKATITGHGQVTGDTVYLSGISGATNVNLLNNKYFTITVIDADTIQIDGTNSLNYITLAGGVMDVVEDFPFSIAFATTPEKFAVCNADTDTITILDSAFNRLDTIEVGEYPSKIQYLENLNRWTVLCEKSDDLYLIDSTSHNIINAGGTLIGDTPIDMSYDPNNQRIGVITKLDDNAHIINANTGSVVNSMAVEDYPSSINYVEELNEFIVTNVNTDKIIRINANTANISGSLIVSDGPVNTAYSPVLDILAVCSKFNHSVTLIQTSTWTIVDTVPIGYTPNDVVYVDEGNLFVTRNEQDDTLSVIDVDSQLLIKTISVQQNPTHFAYEKSIKKLIVCNRDSDTVSILDVRYFNE